MLRPCANGSLGVLRMIENSLRWANSAKKKCEGLHYSPSVVQNMREYGRSLPCLYSLSATLAKLIFLFTCDLGPIREGCTERVVSRSTASIVTVLWALLTLLLPYCRRGGRFQLIPDSKLFQDSLSLKDASVDCASV